ncbi:hypothetical protein DYB35_003026 [Aphanomyces astaci]|uniref:Uncharacterized protein n=2 Tax=Aphanomyces astaci TaxID=112090 RepID=A0A418DCM4_APHAT|nr:hypothetical protein DYB35_003026 [Aphanomyces astaci]
MSRPFKVTFPSIVFKMIPTYSSRVEIIRTLEKDKTELHAKVAESEAKVASHDMVLKHDKEYTERIREQLATAADLLKTSERNHADREREMAAKVQHMQHLINVEMNEKSVLKRALALAEEQLHQHCSTPPPPPPPMPASPTFEVEYHSLTKEHKKLKRRLEDQQNAIHGLQVQLQAGIEERSRFERELSTAKQYHAAQIAPMQEELVHLRAVAGESKAHAVALEGQLDQIDLQKQKWQAAQDKHLRDVEAANATLMAQVEDQSKSMHALERKVREVKGRWKADRDKLKAQREALKQECAAALQKLHDEVHERHAQCTLAQQKNALLTQEIHTMQQVFAQIQCMEDHVRDSLVGRARQRVLSDRHILEAAIRDHVQNHQPAPPPSPTPATPTASVSTSSYKR